MKGVKKRWLLASIIFLVFFVFFLLKVKSGMTDFEVNYKAGHRLGAGETLYRLEDQHWQFKYSPFSALLYFPLSFLPLAAAKGVWYFSALGSMAVLAFLSVELASPGQGQRTRLAVLSCLILAKFLLRELQLGQINALITAILMGMTWLLVRDEESPAPRRQWTAGLLWGLASSLKPYAVIILPYLILKKRWRALAGGLLFLAGSLFAPGFFYGFRRNLIVIKEWAASLSQSTPSLITSQDNVSLLAFLVKWTGNRSLSLFIFAAAVVLLAFLTILLIFKGKKLQRSSLIECALLLVFIPLLSPLGWDYTYLSSFLAVVLTLKYFSAFPGPVRIALTINFLIISLCLYDLLGRQIYAQFMALSIPTVNFAFIAGALFYIRFKRIA